MSRFGCVLLLLLPWCIFAASPTGPTRVACPPGGLQIRSAGVPGRQTLSSQETSYINQRTSRVLPNAWASYLSNAERATPAGPFLTDTFNRDLSSHIPRIGIATSGGGYRAALFGAGVLSSIDARNKTAVKLGTAGLLQSATYIAGLSGGSWLLTSLVQADFPTLPDLIFAPNANPNGGNNQFGGWLTTVDLTAPGDANTTLLFLEGLLEEVLPKFEAGFPITITDPWSRTLSRHFVNGTTLSNILTPGTHGAGVLYSDFPQLSTFKSFEQPFPIVIADSVPPNPDTKEIIPGNVVPLNSEIWEFNAFEVGSYDPGLASFIPTSLLGSTPGNNCVIGFDQAGYIAGISSNLFDEFNISGVAIPPLSTFVELIEGFVGPEPGFHLDTAVVPNPFKGVHPSTFSNSKQDFVNLVDGGLDGEVLPLQPLLVQARHIDTIFAIDASADTEENFTNGSDIVNAAKRAALFGNAYPFPPVPSSPDIFVKEGLNRRPTFFGCDVPYDEAPLIIYIANGGPPAGQVAVTNTSTEQTTYSDVEVQQFLNQAFDIGTQGIPGTHWGTCLACGVTDRTRARLGLSRTAECALCMEQYCWNGH
ncbi:hypothetical protein Clacol_000023 [Clathrus columnatus]|uniref:Lysophospholipase n=1 Tax=Clathrus columnatus TaxID=1419009 RepID=A0AAV4ZW41_9AGAM|nr:hypothetical protein Clacol_000023 [Clathrus columnatus]